MKVLGITGGVGAGKSTVLDFLGKRYHGRVIQADQVAHFLMEPGRVCYYKIIEEFGSGILRGDDTIDRGKLGAQVFKNPEKLEKLNKIVHPQTKEYIAAEIQKERKEGKVPFVVVEAALLIEDHYDVICDELWYIYADEDVRRERLEKSRGYTREKITEIMKNQLPDEKFREYCQFVVDNSQGNMENTYRQIEWGLKEHGFL